MVRDLHTAEVMTNARFTLRHADRQDPTLSTEGLEGLLPDEHDSRLDPALAVTALKEFFTGHRRASLDSGRQQDLTTRVSNGDGHVSDGLMGLFPEVPRPDVADALTISAPPESTVDTCSEADHSEIQRAAAEFQLFAERFHAFATTHRYGALASTEAEFRQARPEGCALQTLRRRRSSRLALSGTPGKGVPCGHSIADGLSDFPAC
jgi:hypothetical protein